MRTESTDSDFGAFVSVSAAEDPLHTGEEAADAVFSPPEKCFTGDRKWNQGFKFDKMEVERKRARLNDRRDMTVPVLTVKIADMDFRGSALMIIRDANNAVFGAWVGEGIHPSKGAYYGSYESDGHYGLRLDETLSDGSSARCLTFDNEPLCSPGKRQGETVTSSALRSRPGELLNPC
ncbi:hypothetical protein TRAPUB_1064 [Trametes pubescens]|uniref:TLDc domain-containing protein n=1 Tax=Trametes pubescens TaxID=154538 RepID=A0A1M2VKE1_TRAPU|nr:hypothetical protein TRAPUB_1064 [Trametes pubescens]